MIENVNSDIKEKIIEIMSGLFSDSGVDTDILITEIVYLAHFRSNFI